jgi:signal transduction histidine kinase
VPRSRGRLALRRTSHGLAPQGLTEEGTLTLGDERRAPQHGRIDARFAAALTAAVCLGLTLAINLAPPIDPTLGNRRFHVAIEMAAALVLVFIAAVLLGRFRLHGSRRTLLKFGAVFLLALDNVFSAGLTVVVDSISDGAFPTWATTGNSAIGALLLAAAALLPDRPIQPGRRAVAGVLGLSFGLLIATIGFAAIFQDFLPGAFDDAPEGQAEFELISEHPALVVTEALTAACYGVAAIGFARLAEENDDEFLEWLSIGSVIAAAAFLNYALFPSMFTELLYSGDLFFIAAVLVLLYGAVREVANEEAAQIRTAVLEERRRVARDLHDGVAQELAYIASQTQWSLRQPDDPQPLGQILDAVERALDESRGAIAALNRPMDEPLDLAIGHAALDVADRVGARLLLDLDEGIEVPPGWREALMRIAREAVANAARHGHARTITVELRDADGIRLRISDDGDGFDVEAPRSAQSFGLTSMRERAESLGGRFVITSSPGAGATVEVQLP